MPVEVGSAVEMINRCFKFQNPDAFGGESVPDAIVPPELRYGGGDTPSGSTLVIAEEPMGDPGAPPLDAPLIVIAGTYP